MSPYEPGQEDGVLDAVAGWLDRHAEEAGALDRGRFCREAGDWVRDVKSAMADVVAHFELENEGPEAVLAAAQVIGRLSSTPPRPPEADESSNVGQASTAFRRADDPGPPEHVERAGAIRDDVAAFRERLRAERLERSREAADKRREFVESIRRSVARDPLRESETSNESTESVPHRQVSDDVSVPSDVGGAATASNDDPTFGLPTLGGAPVTAPSAELDEPVGTHDVGTAVARDIMPEDVAQPSTCEAEACGVAPAVGDPSDEHVCTEAVAEPSPVVRVSADAEQLGMPGDEPLAEQPALQELEEGGSPAIRFRRCDT
ncbi:MAG: hypothetical protein AAF235_00030 [Planctomycetota bacterium]